MTLKIKILQSFRSFLIIWEVRWWRDIVKKMIIFTRCMCSFMSNSHKISWMVSSPSTFTYIVFTYVWPCIVCCFPPCWIVSGPESKKKNKFNSLHRYFIFKQNRLWFQNKEKCLYPYPDHFFLSIYKYLYFLLLTVFLSRLFFVLYKFSLEKK